MENRKIVLRASAGTGKTYRLSLEYICSLINGEKFNEIIVMTFTKKATAEIRERIFDFIYQIAFEKGEWKSLEKSLYDLYEIKNIDKIKLKEIYFEMLKNKEDVRIYTIDGFTNKIFKVAIAPTLGVYSYEITEKEEEEFYEEVLQKILENDLYFENFKFIIEEKNDKKNIDTYISIIKDLINLRRDYLLGKGKKLKILRENNQFLEHIEETFIVLEKSATKKNKNIEECIKKDFLDIYTQFQKFNLEIENEINRNKEKIKFLLDRWEVFFKKSSGERVYKIWNGNKLKSTVSCDLSQEHYDMEESYKAFILEFSNYIFNNKVVYLNDKLENFSNILYKIVENKKIESKRFTYDDISSYTYKFIFDDKLKFIEEGKLKDDFYELIGGKVYTIMIDEFQDTSILQWKILKLLIDNSKNVICVGDEKQSIYSWRGGEKSLFEKLDVIIDGSVETLRKSFRSYREIIENVNNIYENYRLDWKYDKVSYREDGEYLKGYFSYDITTFNGNVEDYEKGYEKIINILKNGEIKNLGKSCIICKKNSHLNEIVKRLNDFSIPYTLTSNASILEHEGIKPLYKLIKFFIYENIQYLLEFFRSDLIGALNSHVKYILENKNQLINYINGNYIEKFEDLLNEKNENISLYDYEEIRNIERNKRDFVKIIEDIKELKKLSLNLNSKTERENFSKEIIKRFDVINFYNTNSDLKNIFQFFNFLKGHTDLFDFINDLENKRDKITLLSSTDVDAINLMTVHKSKGLEFDTVFYYKRESRDVNDKREIISYLDYDSNFENVKTFFVIFKKYKKILKDVGYFELEEKLKLKDEIEEINNDYVALTRAKKNLFLIFDEKITKNSEAKKNLTEKLLDKYGNIQKDFSYSIGEIIEEKKKITKSSTIGITDVVKYFNDNSEKVWREGYEVDLEGEFKRKKGLAMHYYFEHILNDVENDKKIAKTVYFNRYGNLLGKENLKELLEKMEKFIEMNKEIYSKEYRVFTEFEIFNEKGEKKIIDRINIDDKNKKIYIYDYKTGEDPKDKIVYKEQLESYKNMLKEKLGEEYYIETEILEVN